MNRSRIVILAVVIVLLGAAFYFLFPGRAPAGQPDLVVLDAHALSQLRDEFNRTPESLRVIALLSPT